ncbi:hypothetical protein FACS1894202_11790 [Clostridia bacterium]|nr:hypothetical protein FACS1894202_11790 [Clostridia bacterium]
MGDISSAYDVSDYGDRLESADRIKIEHSVYFREEYADLSELTALSAERLQTMREDSAAGNPHYRTTKGAYHYELSAYNPTFQQRASRKRQYGRRVLRLRKKPT